MFSKQLIFSISLLPVLLFCAFTSVKGQQSIKGKIFNQKDGKPISNASVRIPKGNRGLLSDAAGNFEIQVARLKKTDTFMISSIGFKTLKIPVTDAIN